MCVVVCLKVNFQVLLISRIVNVSKQLASTAGNMPQAPAHPYQRWMATWRLQENIAYKMPTMATSLGSCLMIVDFFYFLFSHQCSF